MYQEALKKESRKDNGLDEDQEGDTTKKNNQPQTSAAVAKLKCRG